jgi:hypothetical protein
MLGRSRSTPTAAVKAWSCTSAPTERATGPDAAAPVALDWLDYTDADVAIALLRAAPLRATYELRVPPGWREDARTPAAVTARAKVATAAGLTLLGAAGWLGHDRGWSRLPRRFGQPEEDVMASSPDVRPVGDLPDEIGKTVSARCASGGRGSARVARATRSRATRGRSWRAARRGLPGRRGPSSARGRRCRAGRRGRCRRTR